MDFVDMEQMCTGMKAINRRRIEEGGFQPESPAELVDAEGL